MIASGVCGIASLVLLVRNSPTWARLFSVGAVATVVIGWGVAQWPYMLPTTLKVSQAAAPDGHARGRARRVRCRAAVIILPSLGLLYVLDQKSLLVAETASEEPVTAG